MGYISYTGRFNPFTYDDFLKPALGQQEEHNLIDEGIGELEQKAAVWESLAGSAIDSDSYAKYRSYADELRRQAQRLSSQGLDAVGRRSLLDLRKRYAGDILPLENAWQLRQQAAQGQYDAYMKDNSIRFARSAADIPLSEYVADPNAGQSYSLSGQGLAARSAQVFSALAKQMRSAPQLYDSIMNGYYWRTMEQQGYTPGEIVALAADDPSAPAELRALYDEVYAGTGLEDWLGSEANAGMPEEEKRSWRDWARSHIAQGASSAIGQQKYDTMKNPYAEAELDFDYWKKKQQWLLDHSGKEDVAAGNESIAATSPGYSNPYTYEIQTPDKKSEYHLTLQRVQLNPGDKSSNSMAGRIIMAANGGRLHKWKGELDFVPAGTGDDGSRTYVHTGFKVSDEVKPKKFSSDAYVDMLELDADTGQMVATIVDSGRKTSGRFIVPPSFLNDEKRDIVEKMAEEIQEAYADLGKLPAGDPAAGYLLYYIRNCRIAACRALQSALEYSGPLNVNTDAGEKRAVAVR